MSNKENDKLKNCYRKEDIDIKIRFYQVPKFLIHSENYQNLGLGEKMTYGILRDRLELSAKNDWVDENGYVFLRYDQGKLGELLNINRKTVNRYLKNLEKYNLIVSIREGQGNANRIYITDISKELQDVWTFEDLDKDAKDESIENTLMGHFVPSRRGKMSHPEGTKCTTNDTDFNDTDFSDTIFLSAKPDNEFCVSVDNSEKERKIESNYINQFNEILINSEYENFKERDAIKQALRLLYYSDKPLKVGNMSISPAIVREDLKQLKWEHLDFAVRDFQLQSNQQIIKYPVAYLSKCIYNAMFQGKLRMEAELRYHNLL